MTDHARKLLTVTALALAVGCAGRAAAAPASAAAPAVERHATAPLASVDSHEFVFVPAAELAAEDDQRAAEGLPFRFALPVDLALTPANAGTWEDLPGGRRLWRLRLASPGALSVNLGLGRCLLPPTALLHVYPADDPGRAIRLDLQANADHDQVWTPVLETDAVVLELEVPAGDVPAVDLEVTRLGRGYRLFGERTAKSGACNVDVVCPSADPWRDEVDTVAMIAVNGYEACTGVMVNNTAEDGRPLFLSANHCSLTETSAPTLVAYWNYQSPACGAPGGGSKADFSSGATFVARYAASDFALVELDEVPDPDFGVKYAGWDRRPAVPDSAVCIHHPNTDEKSISFERDPLVPSYYLATTPNPAADHLQVTDWDVGTTEGGSSGSPLFDPAHRVIGQLHGGRAACANDLPDWYGRLSVSWEGGGTSTTRLRDHLDPLGTGAETTDLLDPLVPRISTTPPGDAIFARVGDRPVAPTGFSYTVRNSGEVPVGFAVAADAAWVDVTGAAGTLAVGESADVTITLNDQALALGDGRHRATLTFTNTSGGGGDTTRALELLASPLPLDLRGAFPNPFVATPVGIRYTLLVATELHATVTDLRGLKVRDLGRFAGGVGDGVFTWDGRDDDGRLVPSGVYVVTLEGAGHAMRKTLTFVH